MSKKSKKILVAQIRPKESGVSWLVVPGVDVIKILMNEFESAEDEFYEAEFFMMSEAKYKKWIKDMPEFSGF